MITVDKRKSRRLNVLHPGLKNSDGIFCEILNMSPFGACLGSFWPIATDIALESNVGFRGTAEIRVGEPVAV
jgi:hypothetical protein